jgi:hypothetical protein
MSDGGRPVLWRRLDAPGHESARLVRRAAGWQLQGCAVFLQDGEPCRLEYAVACDAAWRTTSADVHGWMGARAIDLALAVDGAARWTRDGDPAPAVAGCLDVDLSFSPSTNLLPIRRLGLDVGQRAAVRAAWVRVPNWSLEVLPQVYTRTAERTYTYESDGGRFRAELEVDEEGLVTRYPGLWERER